MTLAAALVLTSVLAAAVCALWPRAAAVVGALTAVATVVLSVAVSVEALSGAVQTGFGGIVRIDALSGLIVLVVGLVGAIATLYSLTYLPNEVAGGHLVPAQVRWFHVWLHVSLAAMLAVPLLDNLGLMWVAIEATT